MTVGAPTGLHVRESIASGPASSHGAPAFELVFAGPLPRSGSDLAMPEAVALAIPGQLPGDSLACELVFGASSINLGDIATGRVKNVIDCLWPALGGAASRPADHRIRTLDVRRGANDVPANGVCVRLWS